MAYDYAGSWSPAAGHQANVTGSPVSTEHAVGHYCSQGVHTSKLVIGVPLYGRSFCATDGIGCAFEGVGKGSWEAGVYDYKVLPLADSEVRIDRQAVASWSYSPARELVTFDTREVAELKADWVQSQGLGGCMYWESSGDRTDADSIIAAVGRKLQLEQSPNHLNYPQSRFDNVRALQ